MAIPGENHCISVCLPVSLWLCIYIWPLPHHSTFSYTTHFNAHKIWLKRTSKISSLGKKKIKAWRVRFHTDSRMKKEKRKLTSLYEQFSCTQMWLQMKSPCGLHPNVPSHKTTPPPWEHQILLPLVSVSVLWGKLHHMNQSGQPLDQAGSRLPMCLYCSRS